MDQPVATPDAWLAAVNITPACLTAVKYQQLQVLMFCIISLTTLIILNILGVRPRGKHNVLKDVVYRRKVQDLAYLRQRIIEAVELITPHMLINTWQELEYRFDICRATTGAHIEVYGRA